MIEEESHEEFNTLKTLHASNQSVLIILSFAQRQAGKPSNKAVSLLGLVILKHSSQNILMAIFAIIYSCKRILIMRHQFVL